MKRLRWLVLGLSACAVQPAAKAPLARDANVLGGPLEICSLSPMTGFARSGACRSGPDDVGTHVICAEMTQTFLDFTRSRGNDLVTPRPEFDFPGLKPGNHWCVCALRWREALEAGAAPPVMLEASASHALEFVLKEQLETAGRATR